MSLRIVSDKAWKLHDVRNRNDPRPPNAGTECLQLNEGGTLIRGPYEPGITRHWRLFPDTPEEPAPEDLLPMPERRT